MTTLDSSPLGGAAASIAIDGVSTALHYGDAEAELAAIHRGAALVDRAHRARVSISGPKAAALLTGLVTNDLLALQPGMGQYAGMLTAKGKLVADVRVFAGAGAPDRMLLDTGGRAGDGLLATVRKFINPRLAPWRDERATLGAFAVAGPHAASAVAGVLGLDEGALAALDPYAHVAGTLDDAPVMVARLPDLGVDAFELFAPRGVVPALAERLVGAGAVPCGLAAWDVARVEAGHPEWGVDMDESTIPQEANFDELHAISYTKGCYTGQETVARVHFRGHVNRHLRHLRFEGTTPAPHGAVLLDDAGKSVGDVRSGAHSPRLGALAIAMVRREVPLGAVLTARWADGETRAAVEALPYVPTTA